MSGESPGDALNRHAPELLAVPGVVGMAEGEAGGRPCIIVYVAGAAAETAARIPSALDGWPVIVRESGEFRALPG